MDSIVRDTSATISVTFTLDGTPTDPSPDTATIEILREDGTVLVASTAATEAGTGKFTYVLTPTHTADLDVLTARWTATLAGQIQTVETYIEIVGAHLAAISEINSSLPTGVTATTDAIKAARSWAEDWLEDTCQVAFRPRYARETHDGCGTTDILTREPRPLILVRATVDGIALTSGELADVVPEPSGILYRETGWTLGRRNIEIVYDHGYAIAPEPVRRAALKLAVHRLTPAPSNRDERSTTIVTDEATYSMVTPGLRGALTSIPEVNAVIQEYGYVTGVA